MKTADDILVERKEVVRQMLDARAKGDRQKERELESKALDLLIEAQMVIEQGQEFTSKNAYGLMGS